MAQKIELTEALLEELDNPKPTDLPEDAPPVTEDQKLHYSNLSDEED